MANKNLQAPALPSNEPILDYIPGSNERLALEAGLETVAKECPHIPVIINGRAEASSLPKKSVVMPHNHRHVLATYAPASEDQIRSAITGALKARRPWAERTFEERLAVFEKAADLIAGPRRGIFNAATMHGQSKNCFQAEIDSACELVDFFRFNAHFYREILTEQPISTEQALNRTEYRGLEGFISAITPFNFSAIAGNLPVAPAMAGNVVLWKPSNTQLLAAFYTYQILVECGLPDGVIQFLPSEGASFGRTILSSSDFAGLHFTGSTHTFETLWKGCAENLSKYKTFPRLVGETGGKNFVYAHESADPKALITALVRGAFEYQGQKCSAASRAYIPESLWKKIKPELIETIQSLKPAPVTDFKALINAVIDQASFSNMMRVFAKAKEQSSASLLVGGNGDSTTGYFIEPTLYEVSDPGSFLMTEEFFGPCLAVYPYKDQEPTASVIKLVNESTEYGLTGAILGQDPLWIKEATAGLSESAGNFYINDKPTGAVVGQQPFGGARKSGTNDKAGSKINLYRWLSPRLVKTTYYSPTQISYPFQM